MISEPQKVHSKLGSRALVNRLQSHNLLRARLVPVTGGSAIRGKIRLSPSNASSIQCLRECSVARPPSPDHHSALQYIGGLADGVHLAYSFPCEASRKYHAKTHSVYCRRIIARRRNADGGAGPHAQSFTQHPMGWSRRQVRFRSRHCSGAVQCLRPGRQAAGCDPESHPGRRADPATAAQQRTRS